MRRQSWKTIRSTADPETIANAELKTKAILAAMDQQDQADSDSTERADAASDEKDEPRR